MGGIKFIPMGATDTRVSLKKGMLPVATHLYQTWYKAYTLVFAVYQVFILVLVPVGKKTF